MEPDLLSDGQKARSSVTTDNKDNVVYYPFDPRKSFEPEILMDIPTLKWLQIPKDHKILSPTISGQWYIKTKPDDPSADGVPSLLSIETTRKLMKLIDPTICNDGACIYADELGTDAA